MPLPKAPATRGARLDIREAARNKAKMPAARRRKTGGKADPVISDVDANQLALVMDESPALVQVETRAGTHASAVAQAQSAARQPGQPPLEHATAPVASTSAHDARDAGTPAQPASVRGSTGLPNGNTTEVQAEGKSARAGTRKRARRPHVDGLKLFVLDTNVLMHDPTALFRFQEHDVFLPMITLEELDDHKRGMSEVSRHARQVSRSLDELISGPGVAGSALSGPAAPGVGSAVTPNGSASGTGLPLAGNAIQEQIDDGIPLSRSGNKDATGRLFLQTRVLDAPLPEALPPGKADNRILAVTAALGKLRTDRQVVLVSKDINMRIKAHSLGLAAEDYFNDQVTDDLDLLYSGWLALPADFWDTHGKDLQSWQEGGRSFYRVRGPLVPSMLVNQFVYLESDANPLFAQVKSREGNEAVLRVVRDYTEARHAIWGVTARNREQNFALNLLLDPDIDFVTLLGQAGTGKTLLALTAGLAQTLDEKRYSEIIMTRATVPVGDDIGYLPGTEEEKMQPWMGALEDNLEVLNRGSAGGDWGRAAAADLIRSRIKVKSMSFMRGRTFNNKFLIIDEAQNLTPKQMKTLATRAGAGTKVVCLGNIAQIDTPYLTEASSGLTYVVERFKGWAHGGHLTLQRGERSRLADFAADVL
ncbi:MAG: PhoH family protein [Lautropia sp.]|nr:PhoH family protein [Lautropia sp.]